MKIKALLSIRDYGRSIYLNNGKKVKGKKIPLPEMLFLPCKMDASPNVGRMVGTLKKFRFNVFTKTVPNDDSYLPFQYVAKKVDSFRKLYDSVEGERKPYFHLTSAEASFIFASDFFEELEKERDITVHSFDIETDSDGISFSSADKDPIIAIGFYDGKKFYGKYAQNKENLFEEEKELLEFFYNYIKTRKPDILVGYNSNSFDLPYIIKRSYIHHMGEEVDEFVRYWKRQNEYNYKPHSGMIIYDLWNSVMRDQSLSGKLPDRRLETVGEYFGFETIRINDHNFHKLIGTETLKEYHKNDVVLTWQISINYLEVLIAEADLLHIPLDNIINAYPSFVARMFSGRALLPYSVIPLYSNMQKYGLDSRVLKYFKNKKDNLWAKYEAAIVKAQRTGYFENVSKIDFSSYYPTTMMTLGAGPDNTKIIKTTKYDGKTEAILKKGKLYLKIPDKNANADVIISINKEKPSRYVELIKNLYDMRKEIKRKIKETNDDKRKRELDVQQIAIKVIMNSLYGINGQKIEKLGDMSVAVAVVGYCRDVTNFVLKELVPDTILETDTDGFYVNEDSNVDEYNNRLKDYIQSKYHVDEVYTKLDKEKYDAIYIMKKKNYILKDGDKFISHGSSIVNSSNPAVYNKALDIIVKIKFNKYPDSKLQMFYHSLDKLPIEEFAGRVSIKPLESYKSTSSMAYRLSKAYLEKTKADIIVPGTKIYYIVEKEAGSHKYTPLLEQEILNPDKLTNLNIAYDYYKDKIKKYIKMFNIDIDLGEKPSDLFQEGGKDG